MCSSDLRALARRGFVVSAFAVVRPAGAGPLMLDAASQDPDSSAVVELYGPNQQSGGAVRQKAELATVLGIDPKGLRVLSLDVGGNFGSRNRTFVEFGLVLWAARLLGRPVKYTASRSEAFLTDYQGRDLVSTVSLALDADGQIGRAHV